MSYQSGFDNLMAAVIEAAKGFAIGVVILVLFFAR